MKQGKGLQPCERRKILDKLKCKKDVVKGGCGRYQGTYVCLEEALKLSLKFNVYTSVKSIFSKMSPKNFNNYGHSNLDLNYNCYSNDYSDIVSSLSSDGDSYSGGSIYNFDQTTVLERLIYSLKDQISSEYYNVLIK